MSGLAAIATTYSVGVAYVLVVLPVVEPRAGPLALTAVLAMHLALANLALVPLALRRDARPLRIALMALAVVSIVRFGGEWISFPRAEPAYLGVLS